MSAHLCASAPPAATTAASRNVPAIKRTLANGMRVVVAEDRTVPIVFLSWTSNAGFEFDPPGLEGIASLTPLLLREGTARRTAGEVTQELDDLGAVVSVGSDRDHAFVNLALLSSDLGAGVELLLDMALAPTFPDAAVARLRSRRLAEIRQRRQDPRAIANDELARTLFGATVDGRSPLGTSASVQRIDAADIAAFHETHYRAENSYVGVSGSFESESAIELLRSFDLPEPRPVPKLPRHGDNAVEPRGGITLVDVPQATQAEIRMGHAGVARDCEHLPELEVLNAILGSGPNSRLARSVRQQLGLAYHIRSRFTARRVAGAFVVETSVATESAGAACAAIRREIETLRDELVPAAEIEQVTRRLSGAELRFSQDIVGTGPRLGPAALGNDSEYQERRAHAIASVDPGRLRELARRHLRPERLVAVVVGPTAALQSQFSSGVAHACARVPLESTS